MASRLASSYAACVRLSESAVESTTCAARLGALCHARPYLFQSPSNLRNSALLLRAMKSNEVLALQQAISIIFVQLLDWAQYDLLLSRFATIFRQRQGVMHC